MELQTDLNSRQNTIESGLFRQPIDSYLLPFKGIAACHWILLTGYIQQHTLYMRAPLQCCPIYTSSKWLDEITTTIQLIKIEYNNKYGDHAHY